MFKRHNPLLLKRFLLTFAATWHVRKHCSEDYKASERTFLSQALIYLTLMEMGALEQCSASELNATGIWNSKTVLVLGTVQVFANLVSLLFNSAAIITIMYKRQYHRPIFILFCSLGFSDLLTTFSSFYVTLLFMAKPDSTVYGTEELLKVYSAFSVAVLSTLYNLMSIGIERCLSVAACLRARHTVSEWQSLAAVSVNWGLAMLLGCLPVAGWNCLHTGETSNLYSPLCMDYLIFVTIPNCLVTFTILFGTYVTIIVKLRKHKTAVAAFGASVVNTYRQAEARVTRTSVFIWFLAMASYLPFFAGVLWDASKPLCPQQLTTGIFVFRNMTSIMFAVNSIGNPLLYTLKFKSVGKTLNALKCPTRQKVNVSAVAPV